MKILRGFAGSEEKAFLEGVAQIAARAPFRHLTTPGGHRMSVAMTNCGELGWLSDRGGYRYDAIDPESGKRWPRMPAGRGGGMRIAAPLGGGNGVDMPEADRIDGGRTSPVTVLCPAAISRPWADGPAAVPSSTISGVPENPGWVVASITTGSVTTGLAGGSSAT